MLYLDVDIDFIYIICIGWEFSDSIKHLLFIYKNPIKNNFILFINIFEILVYTASTKRINCSWNQTELLTETITNLK